MRRRATIAPPVINVSGWGSHLDHRGEAASIDYDEFVPAEGPIISAEAEA